MTSYQIASGHNNAAGLTALDPQPASDGILDGVRIEALSGAVYADGAPYTIWRYPGLLSETQYGSLLTQTGLATARYAEVTVKTNASADRATWTNYNAIIVKPFNPRYRKGFYRDVEFIVKMLETV